MEFSFVFAVITGVSVLAFGLLLAYHEKKKLDGQQGKA